MYACMIGWFVCIWKFKTHLCILHTDTSISSKNIKTQICCCSVTQSCLTLSDPMDCSTPGLPVPHHLPKFAQVHIHCIIDAIQPSHPLTPSSSALSLSQHQGLFKWIHIRWPKYWSFSFSISPSSECSCWFPIRLTALISSLSKESSLAPQLEDISSLAFCLLYGPALRTVTDHWGDDSLDYTDLCQQSIVPAFQHTV